MAKFVYFWVLCNRQGLISGGNRKLMAGAFALVGLYRAMIMKP